MPSLKLMTYNICSCIDRNREHNPLRIVDVIDMFEPDIIALQEVDVRYKFKDGIDQAHEIARHLEMDFHFHPSIKVEENGYGNAILSRFPLRMVKARPLPRIKTRLQTTFLEKVFRAGFEPRGILWVEADVDGHKLQVLTTHLGLTMQERRLQSAYIAGEEWLGRLHDQPTVFCGDLNDTHRAPFYKQLTGEMGFKDVQRAGQGQKRKNTFFSHWPLRCLDHIFVRGGIQINGCTIPKNRTTSRASDHLPVIAELEL